MLWIEEARMSTEQYIKLIYFQNKRVVAPTVPVTVYNNTTTDDDLFYLELIGYKWEMEF